MARSDPGKRQIFITNDCLALWASSTKKAPGSGYVHLPLRSFSVIIHLYWKEEGCMCSS